MGLFDHFASATFGAPSVRRGLNDQCDSYLAPLAIHCLSTFFCSADSAIFVEGGGIIVSGSLDEIRSTSSLFSTFPGTSSRNFALRVFSSGPWHLKQNFASRGRTSRAKSGAST